MYLLASVCLHVCIYYVHVPEYMGTCEYVCVLSVSESYKKLDKVSPLTRQSSGE